MCGKLRKKLERPLAYTTVMTTLDRLYKKGLLERRKAARAFFTPRGLRAMSGSAKEREAWWRNF